jgi:hypothetical protein
MSDLDGTPASKMLTCFDTLYCRNSSPEHALNELLISAQRRLGGPGQLTSAAASALIRANVFERMATKTVSSSVLDSMANEICPRMTIISELLHDVYGNGIP